MTETLAFWDRLSEDVESGRFKAKADNVLVRIDADQGDLGPDSLLVVPETAKRPQAQGLLGTVVAVGPGHNPEVRTMPKRGQNAGFADTSPVVFRQFIPTVVQPGQKVVLESQLSGNPWPLRQGEHRLVREQEILAVIEWEESDNLLDLGGLDV